MAGYIIAQIEVTDPDAYDDYRKRVMPTLEKYDGEFLVRGGGLEVLEGEWPFRRTIVIRFPSVERAREWYDSPEYAGPKAMRHAASVGNQIVVAGVD